MYSKIQTLFFFFFFTSHLQLISQDYDTLILKPGPIEGKDVLIRSVYPSTNEGDHFDFMAMAGTINLNPFINRSLIEFDLDDIPDTATILEAKLSLFYSEQTGGPGHQGINESYLYKVTEAWDEHTVTWNTQPAVSYSNPVYLPTSTIQFQDYINIDVTESISELIHFPNLYHGFSMRLLNEEPYRTMTFASSDQSNPSRWPELEVIYYICDEAVSDFTFEIDDEFNVVFNNISQNYDSCYWDFGNGFYSNQENPVIQYTEEGIYVTSLTVFNYCSQDTYTDTIYYCPEISASFGYELNDLQVYFFNYTENADSYLWDFDNGFMSTLVNPIHTFNEYGDYYVCLTASNNCFEVIYCDTINIIQAGGTDEFQVNAIKIYPNPFQTGFKIYNADLQDYSNVKITLIDSKGLTKIKELVNLSRYSEIQFSINNLNSGVYTLFIQAEELNVYKKLIKVNE